MNFHNVHINIAFENAILSIVQHALRNMTNSAGLNNWKLDLFQNGSKSYTTMSENEKSSLQAIADNGFGLGKYKAENILNYFANGTYLHLPELPNNHNQRKSNPFISNSKPIEKSYIKVYPNPTSDILNFDINNKDNCENIVVFIKDMNGKIVFTHKYEKDIKSGKIDVSNLSDGIYMFELICSEKYIQKIMIN